MALVRRINGSYIDITEDSYYNGRIGKANPYRRAVITLIPSPKYPPGRRLLKSTGNERML